MVEFLCLFALGACGAGDEAQAQRDGAQTDARPPEEGGSICTVVAAPINLPDDVRETSGLAGSARGPELFWTHNDAGNGAELFAVDATGRLVQRVSVQGVEAIDWEDIESGRCDGESCLFIGDIGDNDAERQTIAIHQVLEPGPEATQIDVAATIQARYPNGPRDAESLFRLPDGRLYIVTKGRDGPVELYRVPQPTGGLAVMERVRELMPRPEDDLDRVSGATASPDGNWVAVRSYRTLYLYRAEALVEGGEEANPTVVDLGMVDQPQGESIVLGSDGTVWMTSEAANRESAPSLAAVRCTLPAD